MADQITSSAPTDPTGSTPPSPSLTWTKHTFRCATCGRLKYACAETIADIRTNLDCEGMSDAEVAAHVDICIGCVDGEKHPKENAEWTLDRLNADEVLALEAAMEVAGESTEASEPVTGYNSAWDKVRKLATEVRGQGHSLLDQMEDEDADGVRLTTSVRVARQAILDLFVTMWEGGALNWAPDAQQASHDCPASGESTSEFFARLVLDHDGIRILETGDRALDDEENVWHHLTREKFLKGLALWIVRGSPNGGVVWDSEAPDAPVTIDADVNAVDLIFQYALFGEARYA